MYGNYLGEEYLKAQINMTFPFYYDDFVFLPNITLCEYMVQENTTGW